MVIVNASTSRRTSSGSASTRRPTCDVVDVSDETALIAVQGPKAVAMVDALAGGALAAMPSFTFTDATVAGVQVHRRAHRLHRRGRLRARVPQRATRSKLWAALLDAATPLGGLPIGLGARDTLRLESKLPLYGNDLDDDHTPLEAGLGWAVKLDKGDFIGAAALREQKAKGLDAPARRLQDRRGPRAIARHGYAIVDRSRGGEPRRSASSPAAAPASVVGGAIGLAYVPTAFAAAGTKLTIDCRGKDATATVVSGKFYKRAQ